MYEQNDVSDWRFRCMVWARLMHKKNTSKDCDNRDNNDNNNNNNNNINNINKIGTRKFCAPI